MEDRQSQITCQTVNEVSKRKSTTKAKLKAASKEEQLQILKEHFKNLLENFPKVNDKPLTKIINSHLDIKLRQFTKEELNAVLTEIKSRKATGLDDEIPAEVWKTRKFDDILL